MLPSAQSEDFKAKIKEDAGALQYAKVYMKLVELIQGDFFNQYIKSGKSCPPILQMQELTICRKRVDAISWKAWP